MRNVNEAARWSARLHYRKGHKRLVWTRLKLKLIKLECSKCPPVCARQPFLMPVASRCPRDFSCDVGLTVRRHNIFIYSLPLSKPLFLSLWHIHTFIWRPVYHAIVGTLHTLACTNTYISVGFCQLLLSLWPTNRHHTFVFARQWKIQKIMQRAT